MQRLDKLLEKPFNQNNSDRGAHFELILSTICVYCGQTSGRLAMVHAYQSDEIINAKYYLIYI